MKVSDAELSGLPIELQEVIEEIQIILNQGKYQLPTATADKSASDDGADGEVWFVTYGATARLEIFHGSTWYYFDADGTL